MRPDLAEKASATPFWQFRRCHLWSLEGLDNEAVQELVTTIRDVLEMKGCFYMGKMRDSCRADFRSRFPGEPLPAAPLRALRYTSAGGSHAALRPDGLPLSAVFKLGFSRKDGNVYSNKVV